jgi:hypothetical protein
MPDHAHPAPPSGHARTLIEAFLYLDLTAHGLDPDQSPDFTTLDHDPAAVSRQAVLTEEEDAWRVRLGDVEVLVPYASESEARSEDLTFGSGLSELIDPGQWALIAVTYGNRALEASFFFAADSSDDAQYESITADWRFAADAVAEALKFLPDDADELPAEELWTAMSQAVREEEPQRFTRSALQQELAYYRQSLTDFHRLHAE